jgi:hypothetical protein
VRAKKRAQIPNYQAVKKFRGGLFYYFPRRFAPNGKFLLAGLFRFARVFKGFLVKNPLAADGFFRIIALAPFVASVGF